MKLGIIYAGQGSQVVGMGKSFYPREIFDQNEDLKELCFNGPLEKLSYTPYTQPCMVMVATIITDLLKEHGIAAFSQEAGASVSMHGASGFGMYGMDVLVETDEVKRALQIIEAADDSQGSEKF